MHPQEKSQSGDQLGERFIDHRVQGLVYFFLRVVKGIFVTRDRPFFFPVKCEMAIFFFVNHDFHSSREA